MDWATIFINDTTWEFATEILLRCVVMYAMIILFLRLTGKRGVRQLSIFEVTIILALGSIAGDPMFTEDIPLIRQGDVGHFPVSSDHLAHDEISMV